MTDFNAGNFSKINLTLVEDGLGDITREQYEDAINHILPSSYDVPDSTFINVNWKSVGDTKIELTYLDEDFDAQDFDHSKAYDREVEYVGELLEKAYEYACENA